MASKVLIVDDTPGGLAALRGVLAQPQLIVFEAMSGRQALEVHCRERVHLIVMDLQMPGMHGERAVESLVARRVNLSTSGLLLEVDAMLALCQTVQVRFFVPGCTDQICASAAVTHRPRVPQCPRGMGRDS